MLRFFTASEWFRKSGLFLLSLQLLLFFLCLYPFHAGTWFQTEPAMVGMFAFSSLTSLWLGVGIFRGWLRLERDIHPVLYALIAWAGFQLVGLLSADNSLRAWFGVPQTGEGGAWQIMLLLCVLLIMPLWEELHYKKIILRVATFSLCVMTWLHFNHEVLCKPWIDNYYADNPFAPANWPDYLPFIAGWLWIAYASVPALRTPKKHFAMVLLFGLVLLIGQNSSARALMFPALIFSGIIWRLQISYKKIHNFIANKTLKKLAILGIIIPLFWVVISQQQNIFSCKSSSLAERAIFNQIAVNALKHEPMRLVVGGGWGRFNDDAFKYGMVDGLYAYKNGEFLPNSPTITDSVFHPHNQPMAALLALGVIGFLLLISLPILAILPLRRTLFWWCVPILVALTAITNLWFVIPQVMAFEALGLTALCAGRPARLRETMTLPRWLTGIFVVLAVVFAISAVQQKNMMDYGQRFKNILDEDANQAGIVEWAEQDIARGGERLSEGVIYFAENIITKANAGTITENDKNWYRNFLEIMEKAASSPQAGARLAMLQTRISMMVFSVSKPSILDSLKPQVKEHFVDSIVRVSKAAPQREDFTAPFLVNLDGFTNGDVQKQQDILEQIIAVAPNHRSALWLLGGIYEKSEATKEQGQEMKKRAVELGVERVFPI